MNYKDNVEKVAIFQNPFRDYSVEELKTFYAGYIDIKRVGWCEESNPLRYYLKYYNLKTMAALLECVRNFLKLSQKK